MTREEVIKIIYDDPHLTTEQGKAILERFRDCKEHFLEEAAAMLAKNPDLEVTQVADELFKVCFIHGYVYASLELNGEVKARSLAAM